MAGPARLLLRRERRNLAAAGATGRHFRPTRRCYRHRRYREVVRTISAVDWLLRSQPRHGCERETAAPPQACQALPHAQRWQPWRGAGC